ncbi:hypothetical protein ACVBAX_10530 [Robertmurraya sp. GLU-23]
MTNELDVLVDSIDRIANGCIIAVAIFFVITLIKFFIFNKLKDNLPEQMAKKIVTILEWTSLMTFNIGIMWAILNN